MRVVGMAGQVVLADEHDVVVRVAVLLQQLVHGEDIALEAVVGPALRGGDEQRPAVVEGGVTEAAALVGTEGLHLRGCPLPHVLRRGGASRAFGAEIFGGQELPVVEPPAAERAAADAGMGLLVECPRTGNAVDEAGI